MTKEQYKISCKNRDILRKKLGLHGNEFVLHHVDTTMRHNNIERYILWNEEDVVIMERGEHTTLHHKGIPKGPFTEEHKKKLSVAHMGNHSRKPHRVKRVEDGIIFNSVKDALISVGAKSHSNIIGCCRGNIKTSMGYHWEYVD